jgi:hypothetical protein
MKSFSKATLVLAALLAASGSAAADWELELALGGAVGARAAASPPFVYDGASFEEPTYMACAQLLDGTTDCFDFPPYASLVFRDERRMPFLAEPRVEGRLRLGDHLRLGAGISLLGGFERRRLGRDVAGARPGEFPEVPAELERFTFGPNRSIASGLDQVAAAGTSPRGLLSLRAGVGWVHTLGATAHRSGTSQRPGDWALSLDVGGGVLRSLWPDEGSGSRPGVDVALGLRHALTYDRAFTVSAFHIRALDSAEGEVRSWTGVRFGYVIGQGPER